METESEAVEEELGVRRVMAGLPAVAPPRGAKAGDTKPWLSGMLAWGLGASWLGGRKDEAGCNESSPETVVSPPA